DKCFRLAECDRDDLKAHALLLMQYNLSLAISTSRRQKERGLPGHQLGSALVDHLGDGPATARERETSEDLSRRRHSVLDRLELELEEVAHLRPCHRFRRRLRRSAHPLGAGAHALNVRPHLVRDPADDKRDRHRLAVLLLHVEALGAILAEELHDLADEGLRALRRRVEARPLCSLRCHQSVSPSSGWGIRTGCAGLSISGQSPPSRNATAIGAADAIQSATGPSSRCRTWSSSRSRWPWPQVTSSSRSPSGVVSMRTIRSAAASWSLGIGHRCQSASMPRNRC